MNLVLGSDHAGFHLKQEILAWLQEAGHQVLDVGAQSDESTDYPIYALAAAKAVASQQAERGILICGSGVGVCITANKVQGVRAGNFTDAASVELSRQHNDINVLCLSASKLKIEDARELIRSFLSTETELGRHQRRRDLFSELGTPHEQLRTQQ